MKIAIFIVSSFICLSQSAFGETIQSLPQSLQEYEKGVFAFPSVDTGKRIVAKNDPNHVLSTLHLYKKVIHSAADALDVPALHVASAIAAEHAMNMNLKDTLQNSILIKNLQNEDWKKTMRAKWAALQSMIANEGAFSDCRAILQIMTTGIVSFLFGINFHPTEDEEIASTWRPTFSTIFLSV